MADPAPVVVEEALERLVNQFADPMSFLRELTQNALDAGSEEVEVWVEHEPDPKDPDGGVLVVRIEDWGEGMTREIIEQRLTRLFSSGKDGDMTKIGKFGIGFVSVFAIAPDAVCVDTSREGEHWRVLFDANRCFKLIRRDTPTEGTKVRILKKASAAEVAAFAERAHETLRYWCKHTEGEVRFQGEPIGEAFTLPGPCVVEHDDGFSHIVVAHTHDASSFFGFYNRGLTLAEGKDDAYEGLAFKISSPHLEHTLTRDTVIRDEGYARVMDSLAEIVRGPLRTRVFELLERAHDDVGLWPHIDALARAAAWHFGRSDWAPKPHRARAIMRSPSGTKLDLARLQGRHEDDAVLIAEVRSPLSDALEAAGHTVVHAQLQSPIVDLLAWLAPDDEPVLAAQRWCLPVPVQGAMPEGWGRLAAAAREALITLDAKVSAVAFGHLGYPGSDVHDAIAVSAPTVGGLVRRDEIAELARGIFTRGRALVINVDHPIPQALAETARREPEFAAYVLVKQFLGFDPQRDARLVVSGLERRWTRSTT